MQPLSCNEGASSSQYFTPDGLYRIDGTEMGCVCLPLCEAMQAFVIPTVRLHVAGS